MSSSTNEHTGNDESIGIKLPSISFLSNHNNTGSSTNNENVAHSSIKKLPSASNFGLSSFTSQSNSPSYSASGSPPQLVVSKPESPPPQNNKPHQFRPPSSQTAQQQQQQEQQLSPPPLQPIVKDDNDHHIDKKHKSKPQHTTETNNEQIPAKTENSTSTSQPHVHLHIHHHHHHHPHHPHAHSHNQSHSHTHNHSRNVHNHHPHHHHHVKPPSSSNGLSHVHNRNHVQEMQQSSNPQVNRQHQIIENFAGQSERNFFSSNNESHKNSEASNKKANKAIVKLNKEPIIEILKQYFPVRHSLGTIIYSTTNTWSNLQLDQLVGLKPEHKLRFKEIKHNYELTLKESSQLRTKYLPIIPPLSNDYINHLLEIKIPYRFIKYFKESLNYGSVKQDRELWGGASGIYTDDSDILSILTHIGLFNDSKDVDLSDWNNKWNKNDIIYPKNTKQDEHTDLSVTVLILPNLPKYHGFYNNGINSRSWLDNNHSHNGLSIAIYNIKFEKIGSYLNERLIFKKYQAEQAKDYHKFQNEIQNSKSGWKFDYKCYKKINQKYEKLEEEEKRKKERHDESKSNNDKEHKSTKLTEKENLNDSKVKADIQENHNS